MLYWLVFVVHVIVSLFLILVVLLQSGKSGDIASAFGGAGSQTVFGPRGTSTVLTKATTWSAAIFMVTCLLLVVLGQERTGGSVVKVEAPASSSAPATPPPASTPANTPAPAPAAPAAPAGK